MPGCDQTSFLLVVRCFYILDDVGDTVRDADRGKTRLARLCGGPKSRDRSYERSAVASEPRTKVECHVSGLGVPSKVRVLECSVQVLYSTVMLKGTCQ